MGFQSPSLAERVFIYLFGTWYGCLDSRKEKKKNLLLMMPQARINLTMRKRKAGASHTGGKKTDDKEKEDKRDSRCDLLGKSSPALNGNGKLGEEP